MRRANAKPTGRLGGLERFTDDEDWLGQHEGTRRSLHTGDSLRHKFNRLSREAGDGAGNEGEVSGFEGTLVLVRTGDGHEHPCQVRRRLKKMLSGEKSLLAVGDRVRISLDLDHGIEGTIEAVLPRRNQLERADSHNKAISHVFGANVDVLVIVSSLGLPPPKPGLIDRYLVIAHAAEVEPVVVLNKADQGHAHDLANRYRSLDYEVFATVASDGRPGNDGVAHLRERLAGTACIFAGQSGVGKSSLIRACYPDQEIRIGAVSDALGKGRHTTTAARSYLLPGDTRLIDTPGIRECGLSGLDPVDIALHYRDLARFHGNCRFNDCTHRDEPDCAVVAAVEHGEIHPERYLSYLAIVSEDLGLD